MIRPEVGMRATMCHPNDRYAGTIVEVILGGREVRFRPDGFSSLLFERYTLRRNGRYVRKGAHSPYLVLGVAENYRAPEI